MALSGLSASELESAAMAAGLAAVAREEIPATEDHVGSTAVVLERRP